MKMHFEIDCTPEEARTFCGLPDLKPLHDAVLTKIETQMLQAVDAGSLESILKNWLSLTPPNPEQVWSLFGKLFSPAAARERDGG